MKSYMLPSYHPRRFPIDMAELARVLAMFSVRLILFCFCAAVWAAVFWFPLFYGWASK